MKHILVSWKSSLIGLAGILYMVFSASQDTNIAMMIHDPKVHMSLLLGVLGFVAKDGNVTGGGTGQPSTPLAMVEANQEFSTINPPVEKEKD